MKKFCLVFALFLLVFAVSCGEGKKENVYDYPDEDSSDADTTDDPAVEDVDDIPDTKPDDDADLGRLQVSFGKKHMSPAKHGSKP
ncbi:hypothetical protein J6253_08710 [bacterium]|nr:hypothetical protein [bacterium]MBP5591976.1 hypothetical protein [bacterium]